MWRRSSARVRRAVGWSAGWIVSLGVCAAHARSPSCYPARHFGLNNGIQVALLPDRAVPAVALVSSVHAGSRHDPSGYEGLAHFVEHLTFRPAQGFPAVFDLYGEAGALGVNATTSLDTTDYRAVVPAAQVERAIWIEARRLALGLDALSEAPALEEREVLLREQELRYGKGPLLPVLSATYAALYPENHPYHPPFATSGSIERLTLPAARWFFAQYYRPERVRLALVGDFDPEHARELIERHFGRLAAPHGTPAEADARENPAAECRSAAPAPPPTGSRIRLRSRVRNERLELLWPVRAGEDPEQLRAVFSLLRSELRHAASEVGLSHDVKGELVQAELGSYWQLSIHIVPGQPLERVEPLVQRVIDAMRGSFVSDADLNANRQSLELTESQEEIDLMGRALRLVRRECVPTTCVDIAEQLRPSAVNQLDRFDVRAALAIEWRYSRGAALDGEIERHP